MVAQVERLISGWPFGLATSPILHCSKQIKSPSVAAVHKSHQLVSTMSQLAGAADVVMLAAENIDRWIS
jgi:hypothetical protein